MPAVYLHKHAYFTERPLRRTRSFSSNITYCVRHFCRFGFRVSSGSRGLVAGNAYRPRSTGLEKKVPIRSDHSIALKSRRVFISSENERNGYAMCAHTKRPVRTEITVQPVRTRICWYIVHGVAFWKIYKT